ncbi:MAG: transglutaminase domain-containing protein [Chloroflexi bacterium]|nr:transglutaminase domain-containing protein [Chloroflexota bacterium]
MEKSSARWWDLPSAVFLFLATLFSAWRLQSTGWTDGLEYVRSVALLGLLVGLALGQSKFQKRGVNILAVGYMLALLTWQLLGMIEFGEEEAYLGDRLAVLAGRILLGLSEFSAGRPVKDPLFFVAMFCIPYWFAALVSGYYLTRYANALAAVLPSGILMFVIYLNHYTTRDFSWMFGLYIFVALLLLGRQKYLVDQKNWRERHVQISAESGMDFNNTIMVSAAVLILLAWAAPSALTYNTQARTAWQRISNKIFPKNERMENIFAAAKKENLPVSDFYRNELSLGTRAKQSAAVAFLVYVPAAVTEYPRLYWRGRVYDTFENGRWVTTDVGGLNYEPQDGDFSIPDMDHRSSLNFTFNVYLKGQTILYSAAQPLFVSHPANIVYKQIPAAETLDILAVQASPKLEAGDSYHVKALMANPTIADLRTSGEEYPAWVTDRYLQLPPNFSVRIQSLAFDITANKETPYDKAAAITNYLRSEIEYKPSISFPEGTTDALEYFLFDVKQGFCNYYASTEVLMLRSIGIPARLAVGFAQGEANLQNTFYTVRERDAHAWPEVYFPNYGWVEFEPTGNQEPLDRPAERIDPVLAIPPLPAAPEVDPITQDKPLSGEETNQPVIALTRVQIIWISLAAGAASLALIAFLLKRRFAPNVQTAQILKNVAERNGWETPAWLNRWIRWNSLTSIERSFQSVNTALRWMEKPQPLHATPAERAKTLTEILPSAAPAIEILLREHQSAMFSRRAGDASLTRRSAWRILYQILFLRVKFFILGYN